MATLAQGQPNLIYVWQESRLKPASKTLFGLVFQHVPASVRVLLLEGGAVEVGSFWGFLIQQRGRRSCLHILWRGLLRWYGNGLLVRWQKNLKYKGKPMCFTFVVQKMKI